MKKNNTFFLNDKLMTESYQISSSIYSFYKQLFLFESQIEKKNITFPLLPGKSHGWRSLVGCSPWGLEESEMTRQLLLSLFTFIYWRRKWQPTPVFLPGESQGQQSLVGCRLWGCTESDTTEATYQQQQQSSSWGYSLFCPHS